MFLSCAAWRSCKTEASGGWTQTLRRSVRCHCAGLFTDEETWRGDARHQWWVTSLHHGARTSKSGLKAEIPEDLILFLFFHPLLKCYAGSIAMSWTKQSLHPSCQYIMCWIHSCSLMVLTCSFLSNQAFDLTMKYSICCTKCIKHKVHVFTWPHVYPWNKWMNISLSTFIFLS